ncbi:DUF427 domain-containing protein [Flexivirga sp.]|uniref:DUF427 domain-containing protein n=1 Tax=Flexivirga sp. TaxID=1962927 RepID=UPI003F81C1F0
MGENDTGEVTASLGSTVIAHSCRTVFLEGNHNFPISDIDMDCLSRTRLKTVCPWKGVASYYTVSNGEETSKNAAWIYLHPSPLARKIKDHVAFAGSVRVYPAGPPVVGH